MAKADSTDTTTTRLTLEAAIERTGRPLKPLFEAFDAWRKVEVGNFVGAFSGRIDPEHERIRLAFKRELKAASEPLLAKLAAGAWAIEARPWHEIDAPLKRLRPDETSQLSIQNDMLAAHQVSDPSGGPLSLYGPDGRKLYARFAPAAGASAPKKAATEPAKRSRRYGPKPVVFERVCREMRATPPDVLGAMTHEGMKTEFKASAETCTKAREQVQSESKIVSDQNQLEK